MNGLISMSLVIGHDAAIGEEGPHSSLSGRDPRSAVLEDDRRLWSCPRSLHRHFVDELTTSRVRRRHDQRLRDHVIPRHSLGRSVPIGETKTTSSSATGTPVSWRVAGRRGQLAESDLRRPIVDNSEDVFGVVGPAHPDDETGLASTELTQCFGEEQPVRRRRGDDELPLVPHRLRRLSDEHRRRRAHLVLRPRSARPPR